MLKVKKIKKKSKIIFFYLFFYLFFTAFINKSKGKKMAKAKRATKAKAKPAAAKAKKATAAKTKKATGPMTKAQIVDHLAAKLGTTKKLSATFLDELTQLAYKNAKKDFTIPGLGKVFTTRTKRRNGRNPATGEKIVIPAKSKVKFRVSKALQDAVYPPKK